MFHAAAGDVGVPEPQCPQPGHWPAVTNPTPPDQMVAHGGNGVAMRESFLSRGLARSKPDLVKVLAESADAVEAAE